MNARYMDEVVVIFTIVKKISNVSNVTQCNGVCTN